MHALAAGQGRLQRAMADAYAQQTAITKSIEASVDVQVRSEPNGAPEPDKFSGQTGTWDNSCFI